MGWNGMGLVFSCQCLSRYYGPTAFVDLRLSNVYLLPTCPTCHAEDGHKLIEQGKLWAGLRQLLMSGRTGARSAGLPRQDLLWRRLERIITWS